MAYRITIIIIGKADVMTLFEILYNYRIGTGFDWACPECPVKSRMGPITVFNWACTRNHGQCHTGPVYGIEAELSSPGSRTNRQPRGLL